MRNLLGITSTVLVTAGALFLLTGCSEQEFTTSSGEAYELYKQGYRQSMDMQFAEAESSLTRAVQLDPDFAMAHAMLASVYNMTSRRALAKEAIFKAEDLTMGLTSDVERTKVQLALCSLRDSQPARRDSLIEFLLEREPDNLLVLNAQATSLYRKDPAQAEEIFKQIIAIDENFGPAYNMLGYIAAGDGRFSEAEDYLVKYAFKAGEEVANPHDSLGEVQAMSGKYDAAELEFKTALKIQPLFYHSLLHLGRIYLEQGRLQQGSTIMTELKNSELGQNFNLGEQIDQIVIETLYTFEFDSEARDAISTFIDDYPSSFVNGFFRAVLAAIDGEYEAGERTLEAYLNTAMAKAQESGNQKFVSRVEAFRPQFDAIVAFLQQDHATAAASWARFREIIEQDTPIPDRWEAQWRQGENTLLAGNPQEALELAKASLHPNPNRIYPLLLLARTALALDDFGLANEASKALEVLLERADENLPVHRQYLELRERLDD